jgi:hypothetical protein
VLPPDSVGSARPISVSVPTQTRCRIAGDAQGGHLVAFISETSGLTRVLAQRVDASGNLVGPGAFEVASAPDRSIKRLDVGWNGSEWLVAWDRESRVSSPTVFARRFAGNGSALDPQPVALFEGRWPSIDAVDGVFLVAGFLTFSGNNPPPEVRGVRVRGSDGALLDSPHRVLAHPSPSGNANFNPTVVAFRSRWLVTYLKVRGVFVESSGQAGPEQFLTAGSDSKEAGHAALASDGTTALLAWTYGNVEHLVDIRARRILEDGTLLDDPEGLVISSAQNRQFLPAVGFDGGQFWVGYHDYSIHPVLAYGIGDVLASRVTLTGQVLDPGGIPVQANPLRPEGNVAVSGGNGVAVFATAVLDDELGTHRIRVRGL